MNTVNQERGQGSTLRLLFRSGTEDLDPINGLEPLEQIAGELGFPSLDRIEPDGLEVADRSPHTNGFTDGRGSSFELMRQHGPAAAVEEHVLDHFPATKERWHGL